MLKKAIFILLFISLLASGFSRFFVYFSFKLNQKYIAEKLCENKARPWMHCNGNCYLMKKLQQADEAEKKQEQQNMSAYFLDATLPLRSFSLVPAPAIHISYSEYRVPGIITRSSSIFQPPKHKLL